MIGIAMKEVTYELKRNGGWREWVVACTVDGKHNEAMTYRTDDKQDAVDTLAHLKKEQVKS